MFTQPAAAGALRVGEAKDVAIVDAGGAAVAVAPMLMAIGSNFIAGTVGDTNSVFVAESPDPPARLRELVSSGCVMTKTAEAITAPMPSPAENRVSR